MTALYGVVVVEFGQLGVEFLFQNFRIHIRFFYAHIPVVRKQCAVLDAADGKFFYGDPHFLRNQVDRLVHIVDRQVLAAKAEEMLGAAGNHDFAARFQISADYLKVRVALSRQPVIGELGNQPPEGKAGLISRHWLSLASVKKEV